MRGGAARGGSEPIAILEMTLEDIPAVAAIERLSLPTPWGERSFRHEILKNPYASLFVVRGEKSGTIVGFACVWIVDQEMKINSLAVHPGWRRRGIGGQVVRFLIEFAASQGCLEATLEVRPSNGDAIRLYRKAGFGEAGRRRDYYADSHEDAVIMRLRLAGKG